MKRNIACRLVHFKLRNCRHTGKGQQKTMVHFLPYLVCFISSWTGGSLLLSYKQPRFEFDLYKSGAVTPSLSFRRSSVLTAVSFVDVGYHLNVTKFELGRALATNSWAQGGFMSHPGGAATLSWFPSAPPQDSPGIVRKWGHAHFHMLSISLFFTHSF